VPSEDFAEVHTPVGPLLSLRLQTRGRLDGTLLVRPRRRLGSSGRRTMLELKGVLAAVVTTLRRELSLERELAATLTREETTSQLRGTAFTLEQLLVLLLDMSVRSTLAEGGFVAVVDPHGRLDIKVTNGISIPLRMTDVDPETGLFDWSLAGDTGALLLRDPERAQQLGIRSILAVPLIQAGAPLGVVALTTFTRAAAFTEANLDLLSSFAEQVSLMLENQRVAENFAHRYMGVLEGIARSLDARRPETAGYHARVSRAAAAVAAAVALQPEEVDAVRRAGLIHDVALPRYLRPTRHSWPTWSTLPWQRSSSRLCRCILPLPPQLPRITSGSTVGADRGDYTAMASHWRVGCWPLRRSPWSCPVEMRSGRRGRCPASPRRSPPEGAPSSTPTLSTAACPR